MGLYLGPLPLHARSATLVLNVTTGLASPQFHCKFDNLFETTDSIDDPIKWQTETYFIEDANAKQEQQPPRQTTAPPSQSDITVLPPPTAPPAAPMAPDENSPVRRQLTRELQHPENHQATTKFHKQLRQSQQHQHHPQRNLHQTLFLRYDHLDD